MVYCQHIKVLAVELPTLWMGKMQNLYLIKCQNFYKIGVAANVQDRLAQLATGNPFDLEVLAVFQFEYANSVESALHQRFSNERVRGEWFELETHHIDEIIQVCQLLGGIANELPTVNEEDIEDAEDLEIPTKFDFSAMFSDGWRMEPSTSKGQTDKYWCWRRGSGSDREYIYGGCIVDLPYPNLEVMRQKYGFK